MTVAALRQLLDEELPDVVRHPAPWIPHTAHKRKDLTMSQSIPAPREPRNAPAGLRPVPEPPAVDSFQRALESEALPVGMLLAWAAKHDDKTVRKHAEQARTALDALRSRHQADAELTAIDTEAAELEQRLAALRGRRAQLQPKKGRTERDYDVATVRAWARAQGIEVAAIGLISRSVVDQWRAAQGGTA